MRNRMTEYVQYHINGDADCNAVLLRNWANENQLDLQQRFDLAYFFGITYSIPSAIFMLQEKESIMKDIDGWVARNKKDIIFQSDRKYVRMLDNFNQCISFYKHNLMGVDGFLNEVVTNNTIRLKNAVERVEKWYFFGRFSAYLFLETFIALTYFATENTTIDWKHGDTATSGLMNLFGLDNSANYFDKTGKIPENLSYEKLDQMLYYALNEIARQGGDNTVTGVETSLCAYRKFFKGSRYNGYYLDRQLEEILTVKGKGGAHKEIAEDLLRMRKELFSPRYLGELNNWKGIRKDCKKLYKEKGIML